MQRAFLGAMIGLAFSVLAIGTASAAPTPGGGPDFGHHVADMAPDHPVDHGRNFGQCVSQLASTGVCEHHE